MNAAETAGAWPRHPGLDGKVALVTGGSGEIGAATSRALAANGVKVGVNGRDRVAIDAVVEAIEAAGGQAVAVPGDVTDPEAVARMRETVESALGPVDVLAPFAGGQGRPVPTVELAPDQWRAVIDSDLTSAFLTVREFLPGMVERGAGSVIMMASSAGRLPSGANAAYAAAKAGVIMLAKHLANEVGPAGVRVNCLAPSAVLNGKMRRFMPDEERERLARAFPLGRLGMPEDVAHAVLYLASAASSWVTGVTLDLTGGRVIA
ncbi:SDR family NAD(P)-dependent oxidoreductase [Sphaerisporangium fuscum]|uniref:SDR family NAD(P)-dependent oxidoreductase n=1 Tax=Sphaerisporangium fuscum TaxID=2835868 RepID=UPI001BDCA374|nr:SDR family NAD(P)-dependent oxidoreductase [Sphaerisporangium fuscum]